MSTKLRSAGLAVIIAATLVAGTSAEAITGGSPAADGAYKFLAKVDVGGVRSCSGALVDPNWIVTAKSCFPENSQAGAPALATTATIGRTILSHNDGHIVKVVGLLPQPDRNLMLARLETPVTGIASVPLATTAPAAGESLRIAGFGRTATEWVPDQLHTALTSVSTLTATTLNIQSQPPGGVTTCKGDSGGPAFRDANGTFELVAVHSASWQHGCFGETETRDTTTESRVDNVASSLYSQMLNLTATAAPQHAINLSWLPVGALHSTSYKVFGSTTPNGQFTLLGTPTATSFVHAGLPAQQTWYYRVVPVSPTGQEQPSSPVASATTALPLTTDFNGDKKDDIAAIYDYSNANASLLVSVNETLGMNQKWNSGPGNWEVWRSKFVTGDFNGDGRADVASFYYYGGGFTRMFMWTANADGTFTTSVTWESGAGNWENDRAKFVTGDFNGDGRTEIGAFYDYGGGLTRLWVFETKPEGGYATVVKWDSGPGNWEAWRSNFITGDFNGDGRTDIGAIYDYGGALTRLFFWDAKPDGGFTTAMRWDSGPGNWEAWRSKFVTGDFDGDGRTDIGAFYGYNDGLTRLFVWTATPTGFTLSVKWDSGIGNWEGNRSRFVTGDFNGDGRTDIGGFYDYSNSNTSLFLWTATPTGFTTSQKWNSGPGNWDMGRTTLVRPYHE